MSDRDPRVILHRTLRAARWHAFRQAVVSSAVHTGLLVLPVGGLAVAVDRRWFGGGAVMPVAATMLVLVAAVPLLVAALRLGSRFRAAMAVDERAVLKDRISSAFEFLRDGDPEGPRLVQVEDAARHALVLELRSLFRIRVPKYAALLPLVGAAFAASLFVPPSHDEAIVEAVVDHARQEQVREMRALEEELAKTAEGKEELEEVLKKLQKMNEAFDKGDLSERDMMIELGRLDEMLGKQAESMGVGSLEKELGTLTAHLMASSASRPLAAALKERDFEKAAQEMEALTERMKKGELSKEELEKLARNMEIAASKLGKAARGSFSKDLGKAAQALRGSDSKSFGEAGRQMSGKFRRMGKAQAMRQMRKRISMGRSGLGQQKSCPHCKGKGCRMCQGTGRKPGSGNQPGNGNGQGRMLGRGQGDGNGQGGLEAGTAASGNPKGEASRLEESYRNLMHTSGILGEGPVESEVETTEGQTGDSGMKTRDVYAEYAAAAESAIEQEEIPLSHRFHVKRYFQAIRPPE